MANMHRCTLVTMLVLLIQAISGCGGSSSLQIPAQHADNVAADGVSRDWDALSARYIENDEVVVGTATDDANLFVMLRFRDAEYAAQIRARGLILALDRTGGFARDFVLRYQGSPAGGDELLAPQLQAERRQFRSAAPDDSLLDERFSIAIRDHIEEKPIPVTGGEGPAVAAGFDQGFFVYEFRIPLGESSVRDYRLNVTPGTPIGIVLEWGGRARSELMDELMGGGTMGGGPMFPPPGDEMDRTGRDRDPDRPQPRRHEIRLKTVLGEANGAR